VYWIFKTIETVFTEKFKISANFLNKVKKFIGLWLDEIRIKLNKWIEIKKNIGSIIDFLDPML